MRGSSTERIIGVEEEVVHVPTRNVAATLSTSLTRDYILTDRDRGAAAGREGRNYGNRCRGDVSLERAERE